VKDYTRDWEQRDYEPSEKMLEELRKRREKSLLKPEEVAKIKEAFETISHNLNVSSERETADEILHNLINDHRTLQQGFWKTMFMVMWDYADTFYDPRNGGAVEACKKIKKAFPDGFFMPLI
jgi:hypothetical protein